MASLGPHPNIVQVLGLLDTGGTHRNASGLVLEYIESGTSSFEYLSAVYPTKSAITPYLLCKLLSDTAAAITHLHVTTRPVLHRDIWSENVLVCIQPNDLPVGKLTDFGTASFMNIMSAAGFPAHMTYEQSALQLTRMPSEFHLFSEYSTRSECFQFGLLIWELASMSEPYAHEGDPLAGDENALLEALTKAGLSSQIRSSGAPPSHPIPSPALHEAIADRAVADTLQELMTSCLLAREGDRPSMHSIHSQLEELVQETSVLLER